MQSLFAAISLSALSLGILLWIIRGRQFESLNAFPLLYTPGPMTLITGLFFAPLVCLALVLRIVTLFYITPQRPYSIPLFVALILIPPMAGGLPLPSLTRFSLRWLIAMSAAALLVFGEVLVRRLPKPHLEAAMLSIAICVGTYVFLLGFFISLSV